jgi:hypothetical protein
MDNIDYYGLGLSGGEFPPPHSFDSEESYNMAWEQFSEGMQKRYTQPEKHGIRMVREERYNKSDGDSNMYENKLKRRIRRIVEKNCGRGRVREMDDAIPGMGAPDEDVRELAKYHALNGDKDHMLYRDNPDYKDAYDEMTMRESHLRKNKMKITKRHLKQIIKEEKAKVLREGFFDERDREEVAYNIVNYVTKFLQAEFPDDAEMDELIADVANFIQSYEQSMQDNKGSYL